MLAVMASRPPKWLMLAALITLTPDTPGVVELWDDNDELVYVRATPTLRHELMRLLREESRTATYFSYEISYRGEARERELRAEHGHLRLKKG
jgi:hypothetical protein